MIKDSVTPQDVCDLLNELLKLDPIAVKRLVATRVECLPAIAAHPLVQVWVYGPNKFKVGMLGVLNGVFGVDAQGYGPIQAVYEDCLEEHLVRFEVRSPA